MIHVRLQEWQSRGPRDLAAPELHGASLLDDDARGLAARLAKFGVLEVEELRDGLRVQARAHVGRVQIGDLVVTIEPKLGDYDLLTLLRYAYQLRDLSLHAETSFATTGALMQDLLVAQLVSEVGELLGRGLARRYVTTKESLTTPRGRIDLAAVIDSWPLTRAELPCRETRRASDHLLNRVLLAGVRLAGDTATDLSLRRATRRFESMLAEEVARVRLDADLLTRARRSIDRLTSVYDGPLRLIELLFTCRAISLDGETTTELRGFLFDMNRFFQALMGRFLAENLGSFDVAEEHSLHGMMAYVPGWNPRRKRSPTPRPDFVVRRGSDGLALLDAKYRDLWERDLPRNMLYQLAMYALSQGAPVTAAILYPTSSSVARDAIIEIRNPIESARARGYVALRPVILSELLDAIANPSRAPALARRYAFGPDMGAKRAAVASTA